MTSSNRSRDTDQAGDTPAVPAFTPCPGGFITVQTLPDGRFMVESWCLNLDPFGADESHTAPVHHWITADEAEVPGLIAEFTADLAPLTSRKDA